MVRPYSFLRMNTYELLLFLNEKSLFFATRPIVHGNSNHIRDTLRNLNAQQMLRNGFPLLSVPSDGANCPCAKSLQEAFQ